MVVGTGMVGSPVMVDGPGKICMVADPGTSCRREELRRENRIDSAGILKKKKGIPTKTGSLLT
jgi:hypothetical protein